MNTDNLFTLIRDLDKKIDLLQETQQQVLFHAEQTNGRVSELEEDVDRLKRNSVVFWVKDHPLEFAGMVCILFAFTVSDTRYFIVENAAQLIGVLL